jgi:hypothetical protein
MGRRRKHDGDSGLASDQIPGQNQNNTSIKPCHSLLYHRQAFRGNTPQQCIARPEQMQVGTAIWKKEGLRQYAAGLETGRCENKGTACKLSKSNGDFPRTIRPTCPSPSV